MTDQSRKYQAHSADAPRRRTGVFGASAVSVTEHCRRAAFTAALSFVSSGALAANLDQTESPITSVMNTCSIPFTSVNKARSQFEQNGWRIASEQEAAEFTLERGERAVLTAWASGRLSVFAQATAGALNLDPEQLKSMNDREKIVLMLSRDPDDPIELTMNPISGKRAIFALGGEVPAMLEFRFSNQRGWVQKCTLIAPNTTENMELLADFFGPGIKPGLRVMAEAKVTLPPLSNDPTSVSPRAKASVLNALRILMSLKIDVTYPVYVSTKLSVAPPATTPADEANQ